MDNVLDNAIFYRCKDNAIFYRCKNNIKHLLEKSYYKINTFKISSNFNIQIYVKLKCLPYNYKNI